MTSDLMLPIASLFTCVALVTGTAASALLRRNTPERRRLRDGLRSTELRPQQQRSLTHARHVFAERIARLLPRSAERVEQIRGRLTAAGYRSPAAPAIFTASQIVSAIAAGTFVFLASRHVTFAILGVPAGYLLPEMWLSRGIKKRAAVVRNGLADVLDLLIVCLEAGSSLDQAILKCGGELTLSYPALGDELALVANEIRAGKPRSEALQNFASRTRVDDVRALVSMLVQTDRYGTRVAHALRMHAELFRTRRRQEAEERAARANVKLVFPLVFCLFPAFYLISLGPAMLQFVRLFSRAILGGN